MSIRPEHKKFREFDVVLFDQDFALSNTDDKPFAYLDRITCKALHKLSGLAGVKAKAVVEIRKLMQTRTKVRIKGIYPLSINVYGPLTSAEQVGDRLSDESMFLQIPYFLKPGWEYFNPQLFRPGGKMQNLSHLVGLTDDDYKAKATSEAIERVFDSLSSLENNYELHQGISAEMCQPDTIITPLKRCVKLQSLSHQPLVSKCYHVYLTLQSHQIDALAFTQRRENHDLCQKSQGTLRCLTGIQ